MRLIVVEPATAGLVLVAPSGLLTRAPRATLYCGVWLASGAVGVEAPVVVLNSMTRSPALVNGATLAEVPVVPVKVMPKGKGVVWSTPVKEIAPTTTSTADDRVTTTFALPVAGARRRKSAVLQGSPLGMPPLLSDDTAVPLYVTAVTGLLPLRVWTSTMSMRFVPAPTVCANVTVVLPELVVVDTESTVGNAAAVPAAFATIHSPITTAALLVIGAA